MILSKTHSIALELLNLLQCDKCNAALHQPFTTGLCEHLLCPVCIPSKENNKRSSSCPVCLIPVHPKDCQLHPQFASLVLVARRIKKLTANGLDESNLTELDHFNDNEKGMSL